jgi:hypothetical protein
LGVVAAAIQGNVDGEDYISHFRLGLSGVVFERKSNNFDPRVIATRRFGASGWKRPSPMLPALVVNSLCLHRAAQRVILL